MIVVMNVLTLIRRLSRLRSAIHKIVMGMRPGDALLVGEYRWRKLLEDSWLGARLLFGGKAVLNEVAANPCLHTVCRAQTETHVFALFRRI